MLMLMLMLLLFFPECARGQVGRKRVQDSLTELLVQSRLSLGLLFFATVGLFVRAAL